MGKDDFAKLLDTIREKIGEEASAIVSDELISILGAFNGIDDEKNELIEKVSTLESEKDELIKVNGKLYRRIGFEDKDDPEPDGEKEEIKIEDVINEKGEII